MIKLKPLIFLLTLFIAFPIFAQERPQIGFAELMELSEEDFNMVLNAKKLTTLQNIPHTIYIEEGVFIEARGVENGKVVYAIYNNLVDIYDNGETAFWEEINSRYELSKARLHYVNRQTQNPHLGLPEVTEGDALLTTMLMVTNWTDDGVSTLDATTGDIINLAFIADATNLSSPKEANLAPWGQITVSDQLEDGVIEYDTSGNFLQFFAPAGGPNTSILNNVRGHNFRPNGNLVVANSDATNNDAIAEFDASGNYLGNFIANGAGGMDGPFDIIFRTNDCLVSASSSNAVHRYDLNGTYLDDFVSTVISFPQQIFEMDNGNIAVAGFSFPSGIYIYSPTGTLLNTLSVVTGVRSVYQLPNGHLLTTTGTSLYEIDENSGAIIRTIASGLSFQYVSLYDYSIIPVELTSFTASVAGNSVNLVWETATELNNSGFSVERQYENSEFTAVGFVPGFGSTTESKSYSFSDQGLNTGVYIYRLKQIDFDGTFEYSSEVEVDVTSPTKFGLDQNYPNPFNPTTKITYSVPADGFVNISVYNVLGEKVTEIVNNIQKAGSYEATFNATDFASGMFIYRMESGDFVSIKKMMILK